MGQVPRGPLKGAGDSPSRTQATPAQPCCHLRRVLEPEPSQGTSQKFYLPEKTLIDAGLLQRAGEQANRQVSAPRRFPSTKMPQGPSVLCNHNRRRNYSRIDWRPFDRTIKTETGEDPSTHAQDPGDSTELENIHSFLQASQPKVTHQDVPPKQSKLTLQPVSQQFPFRY